jgi:hypothetical protein
MEAALGRLKLLEDSDLAGRRERSAGAKEAGLTLQVASCTSQIIELHVRYSVIM